MSEQIFIIGLPRSGSTLLSRLLNETCDILSFNDLYYVQTVQAAGVLKGVLSRADAEKLIDWILDLAIERGTANNSFIGQFTVAEKDTVDIRKEILEQHRKELFNWAGLMDAVMSRLAAKVGKSRWADKTPQNFMHLELLETAFPQAQFLFLFRDPRNILASYKFAEGQGHDKRRYHPYFYALYWRTAVRKYFAAKEVMSAVAMVRYEDLVANPKGAVLILNEFLKTDIKGRLDDVGGNSSFSKGHRQGITETETWLCQTLCHTEMVKLGYEKEDAKPRLGDLPGLVILTIRFAFFQGARLFGSKDGRQRILVFFKQLCGKNN